MYDFYSINNRGVVLDLIDEYYLKHSSFVLDLKIIVQTALKVVKKEGVTH